MTVRTQDELRDLPDSDLLTEMRGRPRDDEERSAACAVLVERYAKLVRSCVRQYRGSPEPAEDLMQVGYVGLMKAINNYDPSFGTSLFAYAAPCVSGEIKRHFRDKRWQIRVRREAQEQLLRLRKANEELIQELGRMPDDGELTARAGITREELSEARQADLAFNVCSLDSPLSDRPEPGTLSDLVGDEDPGMAHAVDMAAVETHWDELSERDQRILIMRFYGNLTQSEIGDRLGISQMHVSRLLTRALTHLHSRLFPTASSAC